MSPKDALSLAAKHNAQNVIKYMFAMFHDVIHEQGEWDLDWVGRVAVDLIKASTPIASENLEILLGPGDLWDHRKQLVVTISMLYDNVDTFVWYFGRELKEIRSVEKRNLLVMSVLIFATVSEAEKIFTYLHTNGVLPPNPQRLKSSEFGPYFSCRQVDSLLETWWTKLMPETFTRYLRNGGQEVIYLCVLLGPTYIRRAWEAQGMENLALVTNRQFETAQRLLVKHRLESKLNKLVAMFSNEAGAANMQV